MQQLKLVGAIFVVAFATSMLATAAASAALPVFLPEPSTAKPVKFIAKSAVSILELTAGRKVKCEKSASTGEMHKPALGEFNTEFKECESAGSKCTGTNNLTLGSITVKGDFALVFDTLTPLGVAVAWMPELFGFKCSGSPKNEVKGCALGLITPINTKVKITEHYTTLFEQSKGVNKEVEYFNEAGTAKVECKLLANENAGVFAQAGLELREAWFEGFKQEGVAIESEIKG
jgi:hypothetical protein